VSYADLPRYYQTADICCAPATGQESFGIVLLEAMALGKPMVASNIPGYAGVLTHEQEGLLVKPSSAHHLADGLCRLVEDKALREKLGRQALTTVQSYSWDKVARRVENYYFEVLARMGKDPKAESDELKEPAALPA
jgi:phosphatidylinositol alpha-mannosyltransferase